MTPSATEPAVKMLITKEFDGEVKPVGSEAVIDGAVKPVEDKNVVDGSVKPVEDKNVVDGAVKPVGDKDVVDDGKVKKVVPAGLGMLVELKNLYQKEDEHRRTTWTDKYPDDLEEAAENETTARYAILVRFSSQFLPDNISTNTT